MIADEGLFGRFALRQHLGRGGAGDVYLAFDPLRASEVALKLVRMSSTDSEMLAAERRGATLQQRLHTRVQEIADVYEVGEHEGFLYISMEYVSGEDLSVQLEREKLSLIRAVGIGIQLC